MKKIILLMCALGSMGSTTVFADEVCKSKHGTLKCGAGIVNNVSYTGTVDLNGTTVLNSFDVLGDINVVNSHLNSLQMRGDAHFTKTAINGPTRITGDFKANDIQIKSISHIVGNITAKHVTLEDNATITGNIDCENCTFKSDSKIIGEMTIESSNFLSSLTICIKRAIFSNTKLIDIAVDKTGENEDQVIYLKNGSQVRNISFESQKGLVVLSDGSEVTGHVQGGKIVRK